MTVYVSTEVVKNELAKLAKNLKARRASSDGLTDLGIDLELSLAGYGVIVQADTSVMPMAGTVEAIDKMLATIKAGK